MTHRVKGKAVAKPASAASLHRGWIVRFKTEEDSGRYAAEIRIGARSPESAIASAAVRVGICYPKMLIAVTETTVEPDPDKPPSPENS